MAKVTPDPNFLTDVSVTKQELHDYFGPNATVTEIVQTDMDAGVGVITAGATPSASARAGWTASGVTNGAARQLLVYSPDLSRVVGIPKRHMNRTSLPATGDIGEMVYVADLQVTVEYRDATADAVLSGTGLAGWHPVGSGLMLVQNQTGATIEANHVVALVGTTGTRRVAKTTVVKQPNVLGVTLHEIADGAAGLVALPGYGNPVKVYVDPTLATGAVAAGDWLCSTAATAGVARSAGASVANAVQSSGSTRIIGVPLGAFAVALEDRASGAGAGLVMAKMLPAIGTGARVFRHSAGIWIKASTASSDTVHALRSSAGDGAQGATDDLIVSDKHSPIVTALIESDHRATMSAGGSLISAVFDAAGNHNCIFAGQGAGNLMGGTQHIEIATRDAGGSTMGNAFSVVVVSSNISAATLTLRNEGYTF